MGLGVSCESVCVCVCVFVGVSVWVCGCGYERGCEWGCGFRHGNLEGCSVTISNKLRTLFVTSNLQWCLLACHAKEGKPLRR